MAETESTESPAETKGRGHGLVGSMTRRALEPLLATAVTAASAYLARKLNALVQEKLLPKLQEKGGGRAIAHDALEAVADKVPEPVSGPIEAVAEKVGDEETGREAQRKGREQRRNQRKRTLEKSGSS